MISEPTFERAWAMPNHLTFSIKPITAFLKEVMRPDDNLGNYWLDPFANQSRLADVTNDLNPAFDCDFNLDARDLISQFSPNTFSGLLFDPPYSPRQVSECYAGIGLEVTAELTRSSFTSELKNNLAHLVKAGGLVVCFGWNSNGFGKGRGFELLRVLMVAHGGSHNDTIVTVEKKVQHSLHQWEVVQ